MSANGFNNHQRRPVGGMTYNGRPSPTRIHLRPLRNRRRTLCGREIPMVNSVHVEDLLQRRRVSCRKCLGKVHPMIPTHDGGTA